MMHGRRTCGVLLLASLALAPAAAHAGGDGGRRIAVLASSSGVPESAAEAVAAAAVEAARQAGAEAVSPDDVMSALTAANADAATCAANAACAVTACGAVGAEALLLSSVRDIGSGWLIEMRLRDGRRGSLRGGSASAVPRDERAAREAAGQLARRMVGQFVSPGAPPALGTAASPARAAADASSTDARPRGAPPRPARSASKAPTGGDQGSASLTARADAVPTQRLGNLGATLRGNEAAPPSRRHRWGMVLACTGAALLAGGAAAGAIAWDEARGANALLSTGDLDGYAIGRSESRTLALTAAGLGGAGAAALAAGAWLWLGGRSTPVSLRLEPGFAGARVAVAF